MKLSERIENLKLLIAAGKGNLSRLEEIINKGADVNFSDAEGNTVLHYAVESKSLEVVMKLIKEVENVSIENNKNKTPFDIARENETQDIINAIGKKLMDNSIKMLEDYEKVTSKYINERSTQEEKSENKIKKKIEVSLQVLVELTKSKDTEKFTYKNANALLLFLEAFALQDNTIKIEQKHEFIKYFGQRNYKCITSLRTRLVHQEDENNDEIMVINPEYIQCFIKNKKPKDVFVNLRDYAEEVFKKLSEKKSELNTVDLTKIFSSKLDTEKCEGKTVKTVLELFNEMLTTVYSNNINQEDEEEIMFNLIVNIIPLLSRERISGSLQKLKGLRNELLHNFHKFKNSESRLLELRKCILNVRSDIFKYYYSKEVHDLLQCLSSYNDSECIKNELDKKLENLDTQFGEKIVYGTSQEGTSFEYIFKESLFPKKEDIQPFVDQYFKFMAIFDRKEEETFPFVDENEEIKTSEQYRELSDLQKREIFEDFMKLKQTLQKLDEKYNKAKEEELKMKLCMYGITENYFDKVLKFYVKDNNNLNQDTQRQVEKVKDTINILSKMLEDNKSLSIIDVIDLYKAGPLNNNKDIFEKASLAQDQIQRIEKKLIGLPKYNVNISIADKNIQINICETVINILKMFYHSYNKYKIKFNNIKEAFNDKIFLNYLVIQECGNELKNKIKKLIQIEYTAPYVASLIVQKMRPRKKCNEVIESEDLKKLIEILLQNNSYIIYLAKLLSIDNTVINEEVCNKMLKKKDINLESMDTIFKECNPIKAILNVLKKRTSDDAVKLTKKVLRSVNNTILYWYYHYEYQKANEIANLKVIKLTYEKLNKLEKEKKVEDDNLIIWYKLNLAKVTNALGLKAKMMKTEEKDKEATELFKKALKHLEVDPSSIDKEHSLLILCREAYTKSLLGEYEESYDEYKKLFDLIKEYALHSNIDIPSSDREIYANIKNSQRYIDLLALSIEHQKYLDILNITINMGYQKAMNKNYAEACKIYKQVYDRQKDFQRGEICISRTLSWIAKMNYLMANEEIKIAKKQRKFQDVSSYYYESLEKYIKVLKIQINEYSNFHPIVKENTVEYIRNIQKKITYRSSKRKRDGSELPTKRRCHRSNIG